MPVDRIRRSHSQPNMMAGFALSAALLLIWTAVAVHLVRDRADLRRAAEGVADAVADGVAASASRGVAQADQILRYGATLHALASVLESGDTGGGPGGNTGGNPGGDTGGDWLAATDFGMPPGMWAALIDPAGRVATLSPGEASITAAARSALAHFTGHPGSDLLVQSLVPERGERPSRVLFARMLSGPEGRFAGSVVVVADPLALLRSWRGPDVGAHGRMALVGPDWAELAAIGAAPINSAPPAFVFRERSLPDAPLRVRVGLAEADVFASFATDQIDSVLIGAALSLMCGGLFRVARRGRRHGRKQFSIVAVPLVSSRMPD